ncbi:MAG: NAD(+)/NADH kinase [Pseudomonadota bacterium]
MRIGLVVNPIAGLGGAVGLKGTDGPDTVAEALRRGGRPEAGPRARRALARLAEHAPGARIHLPAGALGADWARGLPLDLRVTEAVLDTGTARDTKEAARALGPLDLMVFAGGDGTARDVCSVLPEGTALLGIPCGVKMHSGVFAVSPEAAGMLLATLCAAPDRVAWADDAEVADIDEEALRAGHIAPQLYGLARVPVARNLMQASKGGPRSDAGAALASAARAVAEAMTPGTLYVIGPGTSAGAVMRAAGHEPTVLGTDALLDGEVVARDAGAAELDALSAEHPVRIVLGVTGQQGFLLGRGNQQISSTTIRRAGRDGLIVLATETKLAALAQPRLWVDTGDAALDAALSGFIRVKTGAAREMMMCIGRPDGAGVNLAS